MKGNSVRKQESWFPKNDLGILLTSQFFIIKLLRLNYDAIPYYNNYNVCVCVCVCIQDIFLIFFHLTEVYVYVYIYMYMCVFVCVCVSAC